MKPAFKTLAIAACMFGVIACGTREIPAQTTVTLEIERLQKEYTQTAQTVRAGRQHMLRLEGAISILTALQTDDVTPTTAADRQTTTTTE